MDYVRPQNDILVNFQKIRYNSASQREKRAALEYDAKKRASVKAREAEMRRVEVTPELAKSKNAVSASTAVKTASVSKRSVSKPVRSETRRVAVEKNIPSVRVKTKAKVEKQSLAETAAELLAYSCEEKEYTSTKTVKAKGKFPIAFLVNAVVIAVLFIMLTGSYSELADLTSATGDIENKIAIAESENIKLEQRIAAKIDLDEVKRIAVGEFGMVPATGSSRVYLSLVSGDKIVISEEAEAEEADVAVVMSGVGSFLKNLAGN